MNAALAAIPGSNLHYYELPRTPDAAPQIIVGKGEDEFRVYVHPVTTRVLQVVNDDERLMKRIFRLHGELMAGDRGSLLVELAASWTMVMILTGLILWWPNESERLAGILYPRLGRTGRIFWRDLHSVTGLWVSFFALFLLITGLPWAKSWGNYLKRVRTATSAVAVSQDWTTGRSSEIAQRLARNGGGESMEGGSSGHQHPGSTESAHAKPRFGKKARMRSGIPGPDAYAAIDRVLAVATPLDLAYPVQISPPLGNDGVWTVKSDSQNRMLRDSYNVDGGTGAILKHETFYDRTPVDRVISMGISAHEGHLFGLFNQLLGLFTAVGLILLSVSSVVLWWRRKPARTLGAPVALPNSGISIAFGLVILFMAVYLPLLGLSIVLVALTERLVLRRLPAARIWLGLPSLEARS